MGAVGVADGGCEGIGRIKGGRDSRRTQEEGNHPGYLRFLRVSVPCDGQLDLPGCIFEDRQTGLNRWQQGCGARLPELKHAPHVSMEEGVLDGNLVGREAVDDFSECILDFREALQELMPAERTNGATFQVAKPA